MILETRSPEETFSVGRKFGENAVPGQVFTLTGDLGVGKTVFTQGLAKGLGHAVLCAHPVVGDEPVAVILPDVILDEYESDLSQDNLA